MRSVFIPILRTGPLFQHLFRRVTVSKHLFRLALNTQNRKTVLSRACSSLNFSLAKTFLPLSLLLSSSFIEIKSDEIEEETTNRYPTAQVGIPEPKEFSNTYQMQQAANNGLNSSIQLLTSSFRSWHIAHEAYVSLLERAANALIVALDMEAVVLEQLGFEEKLTKLKEEIFEHKSVLSDSLYVYQEAVKMLNLAANISFLVGLETFSGLALSHLYNIQQEMEKLKSEANKQEQRYLELQKEFISKQ